MTLLQTTGIQLDPRCQAMPAGFFDQLPSGKHTKNSWDLMGFYGGLMGSNGI